MAKFTLNLDGPLLKVPSKITSASFDYVGRYQLVGEILVRYGKGKSGWPNNVLDVGGLGSFLDQVMDVPITILDEEAPKGGDATRGDGAHMTGVKDGEYDAVITSDTLEHIPQKDRKAFIKELIRASNDLVVVCAPFSDHGADKEEEYLQEFYKSATGESHRWLREHAEYVLPREKEIIKYFKDSGLTPVVINQSSLEWWRHLLAVNLLANDMSEKEVLEKAAAINRYYNRTMLFKDFSQNSYRTYIVASKKSQIEYAPNRQTVTAEESAELALHISDFYASVVAQAKQVPLVRAALRQQAEELAALHTELEEMRRQYSLVTGSKTWRYTAPLRGGVRKVRKLRNKA